MKTFQITSHMFTMCDVFHPKGYTFVMFPNSQDTQQVANALNVSLTGNSEVMLM